MAAGVGGELNQTLYKGSDIVYEYACTLCVQKKGSYSEATNYCPDCDVYYCRPCLQYSCDHGSLGKAKMGRWGKPTSPKPGEACNEHTGNVIQLHCGEHNVVGCHVCMAEKHQLCTQMVYITELVSKQDNSQYLKAMQREIGEMHSKINKVKSERALTRKSLETTYNDLKKEMQDFRRKIIGLLDNLEKQSFDELDEVMKKISDQIDEELQTCDRLHKDLDPIAQKLKGSNVDDTLVFIWLNQSNKVTEDAKKVLSKMANVSGPLSFQFHSEIETCLRGLRGLGNLICQGHDNAKQVNLPYSVQNRSSFTIRDQDNKEKGTCHIIGMCQLRNGSVVLSDNGNSCLKQLNTSYRVVSRYSLPSSPYGVCCTGDQEVAVALTSDTIQFVSVGTTMKHIRSIKLQHRCCGIAYSNGRLYVTNFGSTIYVYSVSGTCLREFKFDRYLSSSDMITYSRCISVSPDGNNIYVTNPNKNILLTIDNEGKMISNITSREAQCLRDVCVDDVGNVFVCGNDSNTIIQVETTGGRKVADILLSTDGIKTPRALCFDSINKRLLVACVRRDEVHSLDMVQ